MDEDNIGYYEKAFNKKIKSQPINFYPELWETLDLKPKIDNKIFIDASIYHSARMIATKEIGLDQELKLELEARIVEIYMEKGGRIENFNLKNYQVPASLGQIYDATFKYQQYEIFVLVLYVDINFILTTVGLAPFLTVVPFITESQTLPEYTENYERIAGQRHESANLTIDTTRIFRKNGRYYPKIFAAGNEFQTTVGSGLGQITVFGGSIPILISPPDPNSFRIPVSSFGYIRPVVAKQSGVEFENRKNWSLKKEIQDFLDEKIEEEDLSQLAERAIELLELELEE